MKTMFDRSSDAFVYFDSCEEKIEFLSRMHQTWFIVSIMEKNSGRLGIRCAFN